MDANPVCPACRQGRHEECVDFEDAIVERRGPLLEYRVEHRRPVCLCDQGPCADRHRGLEPGRAGRARPAAGEGPERL